MIEILDDGAGIVEIWRETSAGRWLLLARGSSRMEALAMAEDLVREELETLRNHLTATRPSIVFAYCLRCGQPFDVCRRCDRPPRGGADRLSLADD